MQEALESSLSLNVGLVLATIKGAQGLGLYTLAIVRWSIASVLLSAGILCHLVNLSLLVGKRLLGCGECVLSALKLLFGLFLCLG